MRERVKEIMETTVDDATGKAGIDVGVTVSVPEALLASRATLVAGPKLPYPLVYGEPEQILSTAHWNLCIAMVVAGP